MPKCANCKQEYLAEMDGCPTCVPAHRKRVRDIGSNLTALVLFVGVILLLSLFAGCNAFVGGL